MNSVSRNGSIVEPTNIFARDRGVDDDGDAGSDGEEFILEGDSPATAERVSPERYTEIKREEQEVLSWLPPPTQAERDAEARDIRALAKRFSEAHRIPSPGRTMVGRTPRRRTVRTRPSRALARASPEPAGPEPPPPQGPPRTERGRL
jgi:hypothetical protein